MKALRMTRGGAVGALALAGLLAGGGIAGAQGTKPAGAPRPGIVSPANLSTPELVAADEATRRARLGALVKRAIARDCKVKTSGGGSQGGKGPSLWQVTCDGASPDEHLLVQIPGERSGDASVRVCVSPAPNQIRCRVPKAN